MSPETIASAFHQRIRPPRVGIVYQFGLALVAFMMALLPIPPPSPLFSPATTLNSSESSPPASKSLEIREMSHEYLTRLTNVIFVTT